MINWDEVAKENGYKSSTNMLKDMYITHHLSLREISMRLNISRTNITKQIKKLNIKQRGKGGGNNTKCQKLARSLAIMLLET